MDDRSIDVDDLIMAFENLNEARVEYAECRSNCEYDAGYHCYRQRENCEKCLAEFGKLLDQYIDQRIDAKLADANPAFAHCPISLSSSSASSSQNAPT